MEPNPIYKNEIIEISRRTEGRQFFMRPDPAMARLSLYLIAYYANLHKLKVICFCVMSNHYHIIAQDPEGRRAMFTRDLNRSLSAYTNRLRQRRGRAFWDGRGPFYGRIRDPETLLERVAYVCSNPVNHGAVDTSSDWPGALAGPERWGKHLIVERPPLLDRAFTLYPDVLGLHVNAPDAIFDQAREDWTARCVDAIARREAEARELRGRAPGPAAAAAAPVTTAAMAVDLAPDRPPPLAFGSPELLQAVGEQVREFRSAYYDARRLWLDGRFTTLFPTGTQTLASRFTRVARARPDPWSYPFPYE